MLKIKARDDSKRVPDHDGLGFRDTDTRLYDLRTDPKEERPFRDSAIKARLPSAAARVMRDRDTPAEMFERFDLADMGCD